MNEYKEVKITVSNTLSKEFSVLVPTDQEVTNNKELFEQQDCLTLTRAIKKIKEYLMMVRAVHQSDPIGAMSVAYFRALEGWTEDEVEFVK